DLTVIAPGTAGDLEWDSQAPWPVVRSGKLAPAANWLQKARQLAALRRAVKDHPRGPLLCGHLLTGAIGRLEKRRTGRPYVVFTYALEISAPTSPALMRSVVRNADAVVTISDFTYRVLLANG